MSSVRLVRQFKAADAEVSLEMIITLLGVPTVGTQLDIAAVPYPLKVVAVMLNPRTDSSSPVDAELLLSSEPLSEASRAQRHGGRERFAGHRADSKRWK